MSSYYGLILVILTFVSGLIWLVDAFTSGKKRKLAIAKLLEQDPEPSKEALDAVSREPVYVDYSKSFFPILLFIVVLRSFLYEPFQIPSASMKPTLTEGDFILVNKFNYGLRLPVTSEKVVEMGLPKRGDVAVFKAPHPPHDDYIKRVIGLPGDTVIYNRYKELIIVPHCEHGTPKSDCPKRMKVRKTLVENGGYWDRNPKTGVGAKNDEFIEFLGEKEHHVLNNPSRRESQKYYPAGRQFKVPEGQYFVMGDNRDNSHDGRYWSLTSFVPEENLVGQAVSIWMHLDFEIENKWFGWVPTGISIERIGAIK